MHLLYTLDSCIVQTVQYASTFYHVAQLHEMNYTTVHKHIFSSCMFRQWTCIQKIA